MQEKIEFFTEENLPKILTKKETKELFDKLKQGDREVKKELIERNIRLVLFEVHSKFSSCGIDKDELFSIGVMGLMQAVEKFDITKNIEFATYAVPCIDNEIRRFIKRESILPSLYSLDQTFCIDETQDEVTLGDILKSDVDVEEDYMDSALKIRIRELVEMLPELEKQVMKLYFGFNNKRLYMEQEIADLFNLSQATISRTKRRVIKEISIKLNEEGFIELKGEDIGEKRGCTSKLFSNQCTKSEKSNMEITKEEYEQIINLFQTPFFSEMIRKYSTNTAVIMMLKSGYINGKIFNTSFVSNFLGIEDEEVETIFKETTKDYNRKTKVKVLESTKKH